MPRVAVPAARVADPLTGAPFILGVMRGRMLTAVVLVLAVGLAPAAVDLCGAVCATMTGHAAPSVDRDGGSHVHATHGMHERQSRADSDAAPQPLSHHAQISQHRAASAGGRVAAVDAFHSCSHAAALPAVASGAGQVVLHAPAVLSPIDALRPLPPRPAARPGPVPRQATRAAHLPLRV